MVGEGSGGVELGSDFGAEVALFVDSLEGGKGQVESVHEVFVGVDGFELCRLISVLFVPDIAGKLHDEFEIE